MLILFGHNAKARIIWAHTGFSVEPKRVAEPLDRHQDALWGELSYRGGITGHDGKLSAPWRELFARHSERFLLGSDTWINERWFGYDTIFKDYRAWLAQLPAEQARLIAHGNAVRLFGPRPKGADASHLAQRHLAWSEYDLSVRAANRATEQSS